MAICSVGGGSCNETDDSDLSDDGNICKEDARSEAYASDSGARIKLRLISLHLLIQRVQLNLHWLNLVMSNLMHLTIGSAMKHHLAS